MYIVLTYVMYVDLPIRNNRTFPLPTFLTPLALSSTLPQVNNTVKVEGIMRIYWGLKKPITVAGGAHLYMGRRESTKQEDLPDQWRKEVLALQRSASIHVSTH